MNIRLDFEKTVGRIKPHHAINNAPLIGCSDMLFHYLSEAGIPYSRLHDTGGEYGMNRFVDIENIFRDFDADPEDPASYDFAFTDWLLESITKQGCKIFYRLGATIENYHKIKAYRIYPPRDNLKWAKICEGIIKHYNYGWADGYHYGIEYWEIWNEPDNSPSIEENNMWLGTKEQYFELYKTASNYLKSKFPEIKIGGYSSCGFYALHEDAVNREAHASERKEYFLEFFHDFLKYISSEEHKSPLDFFSWHSYERGKNTCLSAIYAREMLDKYGFTETESILNEWNPGTHRRGEEEDACFIAAKICDMHKTPVDMLMYYDGQVHGAFKGLFDPVKYDAFPAYYALHAFNELYRLGSEAECVADGALSMLAATDGNAGKLLIANTADEDISLSLATADNWKITDYRIIDGKRGLVSVGTNTPLVAAAKKLVMIEFENRA